MDSAMSKISGTFPPLHEESILLFHTAGYVEESIWNHYELASKVSFWIHGIWTKIIKHQPTVPI